MGTHHPPPEGVGVALEVGLAVGAEGALLRQVHEVAEGDGGEGVLAILSDDAAAHLERMRPRKPM